MSNHLFGNRGRGAPKAGPTSTSQAGATPAGPSAAVNRSPRRTPGNSALTARNAIRALVVAGVLTAGAVFGPRVVAEFDGHTDISTGDGNNVERGRERMWTEGELLNHRSHRAEELTRYIRAYERLPADARTFDVAKLAEINDLLMGRGTADPARPGAISFTIEPEIRAQIQSLVGTSQIPPEAVDGSLGNMKTALSHANQAYGIAALRCFQNAAGSGAVVNNDWVTYFSRREATRDPSNIALPRYAAHVILALYRSDHEEQSGQLARWLLDSNIWQAYREQQPAAAAIVERNITVRNLQRPTSDAGTAPADDAGTPSAPSDAGSVQVDDAATPPAASDAGPAQAADASAPSDPAANGQFLSDPSTVRIRRGGMFPSIHPYQSVSVRGAILGKITNY